MHYEGGLVAFVEYLELSGVEDFNDRFIANVAFPPLDAVRPGSVDGDEADSEGSRR